MKLLIAGTALLLVSACAELVDRCDIEWEPQCERSDSDETTGAGPSNGGHTNGGGANGGGGNGGGGNGGGGGSGSDDRSNNGFGNGDQDPPGNSALHNRAENDRDGRPDPSHGGNKE